MSEKSNHAKEPGDYRAVGVDLRVPAGRSPAPALSPEERRTLERFEAAPVIEEAWSCPTCTGPSRETVGMVCQTCGTDYGSTT